MKTPIRKYLLLSTLAVALATAGVSNLSAQSNVNTNEPTLGTIAQAATNSPVGTVLGFAFSLMPQWDKTATNTFNAKEGVLRVAPLWKNATAAGSTPYLATAGEYMFTKNFGAGGELVTLGNGTGTSDIDSVNFYAVARKDLGNIAGYFLIGGGRDYAASSYTFQAGPGVEIRYKSGIGLFLDTRLVETGHKDGASFMTRFGASIHF